MENGRKDIELRSEEVQEILTRPPHALVRWGITVFFVVLACLYASEELDGFLQLPAETYQEDRSGESESLFHL